MDASCERSIDRALAMIYINLDRQGGHVRRKPRSALTVDRDESGVHAAEE